MLSKVTLANTDLQVSQLCYGTNMLGWNLDQDRSNAILNKFAALGGNFVDSARSYGDWMPDAPKGASERAIGAWLKTQKRDDVVVATKGGFFDMRVGDYRNRVNPTDVASDLNESLDHLGVNTIDLYWLHMDNPETPVAELIDFLNEQKAAGKIRWFGASNWTADRVLEANAYAKANGKTGFVAVEPFWGLAKPNEGNAMQQGYQLYFEDHGSALKDAGVAIIPYCAQSRGYFSMLEKGEVAEALQGFYDNPANEGRFNAAKAVAQRHGVSVAEVVLAYLINQPGQVIPIFGASSPERIEESVKAASLKLSADELAELRAE
ncbi:aldo/keto reductase [Sphingobium vermicomposti]|uniref:Aryl-alcohol dehydrogenase-like predicted oxidoreductase n=1 Tax=Sphingobium vermicomposti TaxID=529005 RepID=A0A846MBC8_9SPHN|nr:aldo/keto reductase [Sphingobium vermicomposti]NIJ18161.1 aryl-alcohol dehydrogenase-like predicted oxidoreductase [Sphingobium vermicomposti]